MVDLRARLQRNDRAERAMKYVLRLWACEKCGQPNKTIVPLDGTVKCEQCGDLRRLPSLNRRGPSRRADALLR